MMKHRGERTADTQIRKKQAERPCFSPTFRLPLSVSVLMLLCAALPLLVGCNTSGQANQNAMESSGSAQIANPVVEVADVETINEELGIYLVVPDDAAIVSCLIIDNSLGEVRFSLDNQTYSYRGMVTGKDEDISGLYYEFASHGSGEEKDQPFIIEYNDGGPGYARWYDSQSGIVYSVSVESKASNALLSDTARYLIAVQR